MRIYQQGKARRQLTWLSALVPVVLVVACAQGESEEDYEALQDSLRSAQSQVQALEARVDQLETEQTKGTLADTGTLLSISSLMEFPPTVVDLKANSLSVQMITKSPTTCSIAYGPTTDYGQISTDDNMMMGGHTNHYHTLRRLQPDTVYYYKWGLFAPDGTVYGSKEFTVKTPPAGASQN